MIDRRLMLIRCTNRLPLIVIDIKEACAAISDKVVGELYLDDLLSVENVF